MRAIRCLLAAVLAAGIVTVVTAQQPGGGFGGGQTQDVNVLNLTNAALQDEVKVTADQKAKLKPAGDKLSEAAKANPGFGKDVDKEKRAEYTEKLKAASDEAKKAVEETLTSDQKKRLHQIAIQQAGFAALGDPDAKVEGKGGTGKGGAGKGGTGGFGFGVTPATKEIQKEVSAALKLTDAQKTSVKEVTDAYNKETREIRTEFGLGGGGGFGGKGKEVDKDKQAEGTKKLDEARKKAWAKVEEALDGTQKTAWKGLVGEPFDLTKLRTVQPKKD